MSESLEIKKAKIDSLVAGFTNSGFKSGDRVGQTELLQFLNRRSSSGRFDPIKTRRNIFTIIRRMSQIQRRKIKCRRLM